MNEKSIWLDSMSRCSDSLYRIICFPHAGASSSFFRGWNTEQFPRGEVYAVCYPGRAARINEPLPLDIKKMAVEISTALISAFNVPLVFFGHSMGAVVALETAVILRAKGIELMHLFVSGSRNGKLPPKVVLEEKDDDVICKQLVQMGGTDPNIVSDPIFRELILPAIKADGKMFNKYEMRLQLLLNCPITAIYGDGDAHADIRPWNQLTQLEFNEICVSGDHFYLVSSPPFSILRESLHLSTYIYNG